MVENFEDIEPDEDSIFRINIIPTKIIIPAVIKNFGLKFISIFLS